MSNKNILGDKISVSEVAEELDQHSLANITLSREETAARCYTWTENAGYGSKYLWCAEKFRQVDWDEVDRFAVPGGDAWSDLINMRSIRVFGFKLGKENGTGIAVSDIRQPFIGSSIVVPVTVLLLLNESSWTACKKKGWEEFLQQITAKDKLDPKILRLAISSAKNFLAPKTGSFVINPEGTDSLSAWSFVEAILLKVAFEKDATISISSLSTPEDEGKDFDISVYAVDHAPIKWALRRWRVSRGSTDFESTLLDAGYLGQLALFGRRFLSSRFIPISILMIPILVLFTIGLGWGWFRARNHLENVCLIPSVQAAKVSICEDRAVLMDAPYPALSYFWKYHIDDEKKGSGWARSHEYENGVVVIAATSTFDDKRRGKLPFHHLLIGYRVGNSVLGGEFLELETGNVHQFNAVISENRLQVTGKSGDSPLMVVFEHASPTEYEAAFD